MRSVFKNYCKIYILLQRFRIDIDCTSLNKRLCLVANQSRSQSMPVRGLWHDSGEIEWNNEFHWLSWMRRWISSVEFWKIQFDFPSHATGQPANRHTLGTRLVVNAKSKKRADILRSIFNICICFRLTDCEPSLLVWSCEPSLLVSVLICVWQIVVDTRILDRPTEFNLILCYCLTFSFIFDLNYNATFEPRTATAYEYYTVIKFEPSPFKLVTFYTIKTNCLFAALTIYALDLKQFIRRYGAAFE